MAKTIEDLLTLKEATKILRVHPGTLRRLDNLGHLRAVRVGTRRGVGDRRYRLEDIDAYIKRQKK